MLTELVRPGERIEIKAVAHAIMGKASDKQAYTSRVYDILDDEQLEILMPMDGTKLLLLPVGGEYEFCFYLRKSSSSETFCTRKIEPSNYDATTRENAP